MQDSFGRTIDYLRLSVTERCDLRCRYCMEEAGVPKRSHAEMLRLEELAEIGGAASPWFAGAFWTSAGAFPPCRASRSSASPPTAPSSPASPPPSAPPGSPG